MTSPDLEQLRTVVQAQVLKQAQPAAQLTRTVGGIEFRYLPDWLRARKPPIATSLPIATEPLITPSGALPSFFTNLLPEGRRLTALRRAVKTSADDELSLLLAVGGDVIGDVQILSERTTPPESQSLLTVADFASVSFAELAAELGIRVDRVGIPGVQDKVSARMINLPVARRADRFILKLDPPEYPHLVRNEAFFLRAARLSGIRTAEARLVTDAEGRDGLLVTRFDRVAGDAPDEAPRMLAVEDGCQVLNRPPADKYTVSAEITLAALADQCQARLPAARVLLQQLVFAYLSGNGDAHAKNFSVLQETSGERRPAPAYDLPSSQPYGDTTMALPIATRVSDDYGRPDFVALGTGLGLPERSSHRLIDELVRRSPRWMADLDQLPFDTGRIRKLRRVVEHRRHQLA